MNAVNIVNEVSEVNQMNAVPEKWIGPTAIPVQGYENYLIDIQGRVYSRKKAGFKERARSKNGVGYSQMYLFKSGKHKSPLVHRLVWESFVGPVPKGLELDHINQDKNDNSLQNLRLATKSQNCCNNKAKNYFFCNTTKKWIVVFKTNHKIVFRKAFATQVEAQHAADIVRPAVYGAFARTI